MPGAKISGTGVATIGGGTGTTGTPATTDPNAPISPIPPSGTNIEPPKEPVITTPSTTDPNAQLGTGASSGSPTRTGTVTVGDLVIVDDGSKSDSTTSTTSTTDPNAQLGTGESSGSRTRTGIVTVGDLVVDDGSESGPIFSNSVTIDDNEYSTDDPLYTIAKIAPWLLQGKTPAELSALRAKEQAKRDTAARNATPNQIITAPTHTTAWGTVSSEPLYGTEQFPVLNTVSTFQDMADARSKLQQLIDKVPVLGQIDDAYNYIAENYVKGSDWFDQNLFNGAGKIVEDLGRIFIPYGNMIAVTSGLAGYQSDPSDPWYLKGLNRFNNAIRSTPFVGAPISLIEDMARAAYFGIENIFDPNNLDRMELIRKSQDEGDYETARQIAEQIAAEGDKIGEATLSDEGLDNPIIPDIQVDEQGNLIEPLEEVNTTAALPNIDYSAIEFTPEELSLFDKYRLNPDDTVQISNFLSTGNLNSIERDILDRYIHGAGQATSGAGVGSFADALNTRGQITGDLSGDIGYVPHNPGNPDTAGQLAYGVPVAPFDLLSTFSGDVTALTEAQNKAQARADLGTLDESLAIGPTSDWGSSKTWEQRMQDYANAELANYQPILPDIPEPEIPEVSVAYDPSSAWDYVQKNILNTGLNELLGIFSSIDTGLLGSWESGGQRIPNLNLIGALGPQAQQDEFYRILKDDPHSLDQYLMMAKELKPTIDDLQVRGVEDLLGRYGIDKTQLVKAYMDKGGGQAGLDAINSLVADTEEKERAWNEWYYGNGQWQPGWGQWDIGESGMFGDPYNMAGWVPSTLTGVEFQPRGTVTVGDLEVVNRASGGEIEGYREGGVAGLADGEFVIPADVVSGLGNGSTKAGARKIYEFLGESPIDPFGEGGETEYYKVGGQLLDGPGDGMSDSIPAMITGNEPQPAALADGEFVVSNNQVARIGGGSTKVGARKLYQLMDDVRRDRTGTTKQAPQINANKHLNKLVRGR